MAICNKKAGKHHKDTSYILSSRKNNPVFSPLFCAGLPPIKLMLTIVLMMLLFLPLAIAQQEYTTKGVSRDSSYQQDGTGNWAGRAAVTSTRLGTYGGYNSPIISDYDNDGTNEIAILEGTSVVILNYTEGAGFGEEASISLGAITYSAHLHYQTLGQLDYNSDGYIDIVAFNTSHVLRIAYNGSNWAIRNSTATGLGTGAGLTLAQYPVIKCAPGTQWASGNDTCVLPIRNQTGTVDMGFLAYDMDDNTAWHNTTGGIPNSDTDPANTHLCDIDSDGYLEALYRYSDAPNDDIDVYMAEITSTGQVISTLHYSHNLAGTTDFTDIICNNLDGNAGDGLEVTHGYTDDGTNWYGYTVDKDGTVIESQYCSGLTCPEGEAASFNLFVASDTTYADNIGDVCYYVRNSANNDPGTDTDTVHCLSIIFGVSTDENEITNTQNFTHTFTHVHETALHLTTGLLLDDWTAQGVTLQTRPNIANDQFTMPVDYQQTGTLDVLGWNTSRIRYYDDALTNANVVINSVSVDTGNPVCVNEIVTLTASIEDELNDAGECHIQETWGNSTPIANHSNTTFNEGDTSVDLNYFGDTVGTFILEIRCQDQFNTAWAERTYTISVSNDTTLCNIKGEAPTTTDYTSASEEASNDAFQGGVDNWLSDLGVDGSVAKGFFWLLVMTAVAFLLIANMQPGTNVTMAVVMVEVIMLVLGWVLGMISAAPLVILGLFCSMVIIAIFFGRGGNSQ